MFVIWSSNAVFLRILNQKKISRLCRLARVLLPSTLLVLEWTRPCEVKHAMSPWSHWEESWTLQSAPFTTPHARTRLNFGQLSRQRVELSERELMAGEVAVVWSWRTLFLCGLDCSRGEVWIGDLDFYSVHDESLSWRVWSPSWTSWVEAFGCASRKHWWIDDGSQFDSSTEKQQFLFFFISFARWNHDISSSFFMIFIPHSIALPTS